MTNGEAIKRIKSNMEYRKSWSMVHHDTLNTCISKIEENTKLKAEIELWEKSVEYYKEKLLEFNNDNAELKAENEKLKKEIENLLVDKECWTCKHEELSSLSEPCYSCDDCVNWERKE